MWSCMLTRANSFYWLYLIFVMWLRKAHTNTHECRFVGFGLAHTPCLPIIGRHSIWGHLRFFFFWSSYVTTDCDSPLQHAKPSDAFLFLHIKSTPPMAQFQSLHTTYSRDNVRAFMFAWTFQERSWIKLNAWSQLNCTQITEDSPKNKCSPSDFAYISFISVLDMKCRCSQEKDAFHSTSGLRLVHKFNGNCWCFIIAKH